MLLNLSKKDDKPLSHFTARFAIEIQGVPYTHPSLVIQTFMMGLRLLRFFWSLVEKSSNDRPRDAPTS
ncbi:hypothetical protein BHE74_00009229 [Ensete ventricosum]|nr:hypothetical protein GW17_00008395 [Ensete ventricosum]RWW82325.1 hypothetical protein BHE74_00009229 [Ensete ventricosum]